MACDRRLAPAGADARGLRARRRLGRNARTSGMILLGGIASEGTVAFLIEALDRLGSSYQMFQQRRCADYEMEMSVAADGVRGQLRLERATYDLRQFSAVYVRLMDDRIPPELEDEPQGSPARRHRRGLHDTLSRWIELADACVVNRSDPQGSNSSKPFQAQLIFAHGLRVPDTLITNDPAEVLAFQRAHGQIIYKSMSGVRSIVKALDDDDIAWSCRWPHLHAGPCFRNCFGDPFGRLVVDSDTGTLSVRRGRVAVGTETVEGAQKSRQRAAAGGRDRALRALRQRRWAESLAIGLARRRNGADPLVSLNAGARA
jgi:hypothetical protein